MNSKANPVNRPIFSPQIRKHQVLMHPEWPRPFRVVDLEWTGGGSPDTSPNPAILHITAVDEHLHHLLLRVDTMTPLTLMAQPIDIWIEDDPADNHVPSQTTVFRVETTDDSITLFDGDEELVMWDSTEWIEDPALILTIANAINIGHTEGPDGVRARLIIG